MRNEDLRRRIGVESGDFYITAPAPCPYLPGKRERKVFSYLDGPGSQTTNGELTRRGFRRSQNIIYVPACDACAACVPVRIVVGEFAQSRSRRRVQQANADLLRRVRGPRATSAQFSILRSYLDVRHNDGGMADMTMLDYAAMVEETSVETVVVEYSVEDGRGGERLIACALTDRLSDGLSMVYSFFEPEEARRSLGQFMILDHVAMARRLGLPYVYLGYWVSGSEKMDYKARYQPLERLTRAGWVAMAEESC